MFPSAGCLLLPVLILITSSFASPSSSSTSSWCFSADLLANSIQHNYYDPSTATWGCGISTSNKDDTPWPPGPSDQPGWWNCANTFTAIVNFMEVCGHTNSAYWRGIVDRHYRRTAQRYPHRIVTGKSMDDMAWEALSWHRAGLVTKNNTYFLRTNGFFGRISQFWDTTVCGGGVWWSAHKTYKNAITNELYWDLAGAVANTSMLQQESDWFQNRVHWMKDPQSGLIVDGLDSTSCRNVGGVYTYNQGVILGGLLRSAHQVGSSSPTKLAAIMSDIRTIVHAVFNTINSSLVDGNGTLQEAMCEPNCNFDGQQFKGIFMRYLGYVVDSPLLSPTDRVQYCGWIVANANKVLGDAIIRSNWTASLVWASSSSGSGVKGPITVVTTTSVMDLFTAAARCV